MVIFALFCAVVLVPIFKKTLVQYGFSQSKYIAYSALGMFSGAIIGTVIDHVRATDYAVSIGGWAGILFVYLIYISIALENKERLLKNTGVAADDKIIRKKEKQREEKYSHYIPVKTYMSNHEQFQFQIDLKKLEDNGIKTAIRNDAYHHPDGP